MVAESPHARGYGAARQPTLRLIQPQLRNVPRVRLQLAVLDALDEIGQHGVGAAGQTEFFALAHHQPVEEFDFGAAAFLHVLAHRGTLRGGGALAICKTLGVAGAHRRLVALPRARDRLRRKMQDLLQLIAERLANADRFAAKPRGEAADRLALQPLAAPQPGARTG